jgi:hypothetical protein
MYEGALFTIESMTGYRILRIRYTPGVSGVEGTESNRRVEAPER